MAEDKVTFSDWLEAMVLGARWFISGARLLMWAGGLVATIGVPVYALLIGNTQAQIASVANTQDARAKDSENFQAEVRGKIATVEGKITDVGTDVAEQQRDMFQVKVDIGVIKRLLTDIRRDAAVTVPLAPTEPRLALAGHLGPLGQASLR